MTTKEKTIRSVVGMLIAVFLFFEPMAKIPLLDSQADNYFKESMAKASMAYASCRIINASVSMIKDSSLQLMGVSLAVGQVLDPIDDMTERLSEVLVMAITSLGVQKLAYEIGLSLAPSLIAICLLILSFLLWIPNEKTTYIYKATTSILMIILAARLCFPVASIANSYIYQHYFSEQISKAKDALSLHSDGIDKLKDFSVPESSGYLSGIKNAYSFIGQKAAEVKKALIVLSKNMPKLIENILKMLFLYVGIFVIQVLLLPLLSFWVILKTANPFFATHLPDKV